MGGKDEGGEGGEGGKEWGGMGGGRGSTNCCSSLLGQYLRPKEENNPLILGQQDGFSHHN